MNIVTDTSAVIAVLIDENTKQAVIEATQEAGLLAPASLTFEVGNAFTAMFKKRVISLEKVLDVLDIFETIPIRLVDVDLGQAVILANELNIYAYDAYMIEVARRYHTPLITLDKQLADAAIKIGIETILVR